MKRLSIAEFCEVNDITKSHLADCLGLHRQRIYNMEASEINYVVDFNSVNGDIEMVKTDAVVHSGNISIKKAVEE